MKQKRTIVGRMLLYLLIVNSVLLCLLGSSLTFLSDSAFQNEVIRSTEQSLTQTNTILSNCFVDLCSRLVHLASLQCVRSCLSKPAADYAGSLAQTREMDRQFANIELFNPVKDVLILGNNGFAYNLDGRSNLISDFDYTATDWYRQATDISSGLYIHVLPLHDQSFYSRLAEPAAFRSQTFSLSMAVCSADTFRVIGAVVCNFDLERLSALLDESRTESGERIALIDPDGMICAQNDNRQTGSYLNLREEDLSELIRTDRGHFNTVIDGTEYLLCFHPSNVSGWKLISYIPVSAIKAHSAPLWRVMCCAIVAGLVINTLIALFYMRSVRRPINRLVQSLMQVDAENIKNIDQQYSFEELRLISEKTNEILERIRRLIRENYQTQLELSRFELSALRSQINPHFLFNTLQLLQTEIVYGNVERSNKIIVTLSQLLRYYLYDNDAQVTLKSEMSYLDKYLMLFNGKYEGRLKTSISLEEEAGEIYVPKLLIQPIVENSIRYAAEQNGNDCEISIKACIEQERLLICVSDNGPGISLERLREVRQGLENNVDWSVQSIGLANVHQRIRTLCGEQYGLTIDSDGSGTDVSMVLPCLRQLPGKAGSQ